MLQFRDVDEEQRVRDVAAYGTLPLHPASHCVKYAYKEEEEEEAEVSRIGAKLICRFIGKNSEAREHRRRSVQRRRPERRKGRRDKKMFICECAGGVFLSFQEKSPAGVGWCTIFLFSQL